MVSKEQKIKMLNNLSEIIKVLPTSSNINEIHQQTGISTSTIQRYLNRKDLLLDLIGDDTICEEIFQVHQEWLKSAKKEGLQKGGRVSQERYGYLKEEDGKFRGNKNVK